MNQKSPQTRLREVGPEMVSLRELLICVLGGGDTTTVDRLLAKFKSLHEMSLASESALRKVDGIGKIQAARIRASLELGHRLLTEGVESSGGTILQPSDLAKIFSAKIGAFDREHFAVAHLNTRNQVTEVYVLYSGTLNTSLVRIGEIFRGAIESNAAAIAVCHTHPSGNPEPTAEDIATTRRLVQAGKLLEVEVLDHIIIGHTHRGFMVGEIYKNFVSMRERGVGFE